MIKLDEDALQCDLAETYNIYNYKELPASKVALFSYGLRDDSRIKMKMSGQKKPIETMLQASIADSLRILVWFKTKDGQKGKNRPQSFVDLINSTHNESEKEVVVFNSGKDFESRRLKLIGGE